MSSEDLPERNSIWYVLRDYKQNHRNLRNGKRSFNEYTENDDQNIENVLANYQRNKLKKYNVLRWLKQI